MLHGAAKKEGGLDRILAEFGTCVCKKRSIMSRMSSSPPWFRSKELCHQELFNLFWNLNFPLGLVKKIENEKNFGTLLKPYLILIEPLIEPC